MSFNIPGPGISRNLSYTYNSLSNTTQNQNVPSEILNWAQNEAIPYVQQLQAMLDGRMPDGGPPLTAAERSEALRNIDTVMSQLRQYNLDGMVEGSDWNPLDGNYDAVPGTPSANPLGRNTQPDFIDGSSLIYDGSVRPAPNGFAFQATADKRTIVSYHSYNQLNFPSASDQINVTSEANPHNPGQQMIVVTRTLRDGSTQRFEFPNSNRSDFKLNLRAVSADQINLPDALKEKCKIISADDENTDSTPMGTPPQRRENGVNIWDTDRADIYPDPTSNGHISVRDTVTYHASSNTQYHTIEWSESSRQYVIKTYSDAAHTNLVTTNNVDDFRNLKIRMDVDPDRMQFLGELANETNPHRAKVQVSSGDPVQERQDRDATPSNRTDEAGNLIWDREDEVTIRVSQGAGEYRVSADSLTLRPENRSQAAFVTKTADGSYVIEIRDSSQVDSGGRPLGNMVRTVTLDQAEELKLEGFDGANVRYREEDGGRYESFSGQDSVISVGRRGATEDTPAVEVQGDSPNRPNSSNGDRNWDGSDFNIYTRGDGKVNNISARGTVQLHVSSNSEYWKVSYDGSKYIVEVYDNSARTGTPKETFNVDGMAANVQFDVPTGHITFEGNLGAGTGNQQINTTNTAAANLSFIGGAESGDVNSSTGEASLPQPFANLKNLNSSMSQSEFLAKLQQYFPNIDANFDGRITTEDLTQAQSSGVFPPSVPNNNLINFLKDIDPAFNSRITTLRSSTSASDAEKTQTMIQASERAVFLLNALYPGKNFRLIASAQQGPNHANNIAWGNNADTQRVMEIFSEGNRSTTFGDISIMDWTPAGYRQLTSLS